MSRLRSMLLTASLCAGFAATAAAQPAPAAAAAQGAPAIQTPVEPPLLFDPQQLPAFHGKVAAYTLTPRGGADGFILDDGSQVHVSPRLSTQLVFLVRPGDTVTVHGVKAEQGGLILALSVANDAGGKVLTDPLVSRKMRGEPVAAQGRIKARLYGPHDDMDGVVLDDGSQIRLWPGAARRIAAELAPGQAIYARGFGEDTLLGKVVMPQVIGPNEAEAVPLPGMPFGMAGGPGAAPWQRGPMMPGMDGQVMQGSMHGPGQFGHPPVPVSAPTK